jgi:subtilisin family serine protease
VFSRHFRTVMCIFGALAGGGALRVDKSEAAPATAAPGAEYREGTLLVRFAPQANEASRLTKRKRLAAQRLKGFDRLVPGLEIWRLPKHVTVAAALAALKKERDLLYVEPDYVLHADITPNDPSFSSLWGLENTGQTGGSPDADIDAPQAWESTVGSSEVIVGVVDTGIDYRHPDLAANMWINAGEIPGNGIDDDANGFVDDVHGWNAIANNGDPLDNHRHGTHVAGTIGARGNNGTGVVGVNWTVKLMALKFLDASGRGTTADAIEAIDYAVAQRRRGINVRVLNNSWGGGAFNNALFDSISAAENADILFVAAAGNNSSDNDATPTYPASYEVPNVVAVAATTHTDALATFSNYGGTSVDLGAPGASILSTTPNASYGTLSGTSMATPHVSGVAALMLSVQPTMDVHTLKASLLQAVDPLPSLSGRTVTGGRINAQKAVAALGPVVPSFQLSVSPSSALVSQGDVARFEVPVTSIGGFTGNVTLSLSSLPALQGAAVSFTPDSVATGDTATLSIASTTATAVGTYQLTITAVSGDITRTASAILTVDPAGTTTLSYRNPTAMAIPDANLIGVTSTIEVPDPLAILGASITVDINHTYIGDLEVALISPTGTRVVLHDQAGGSADNIHQTYALNAFNGQTARGTWTLTVRDLVALDVGRLEGWTLTLKASTTGPGTVAGQP